MSEPLSFKVTPQQKTIINKALKLCKEKHKLNVRRDQLENIVNHYLQQFIETDEESDVVSPTKVYTAKEKDLLTLCPMNLLKQQIDPKDDLRKWYCLRRISLRSSGKPMMIADGLDIDSIIEYCDACEIGTSFDKQLKLTTERIEAIRRFGETEIKTIAQTCIHPKLEFMQILLGDFGELRCYLRNDERVDIHKVCLPHNCEYYSKEPITFNLKATKAHKELMKQLENKRKGGD